MFIISRTEFPATVVNARIAESIAVFYESMEDFFKKKRWRWAPYRRNGDKWIQEDYSIEVKGKHRDGAYRDIEFAVRRTPGVIGASRGRNSLNLGFNHKFLISLPRSYPANLAKITMRALTRLWHPRISMSGSGEACITVNGEVDRILVDLIYNLLLDPKRIRPPKLYPKEDSGMNVSAMRWFEKDAENIHRHMLAKWDSLHEKSSLKEEGGIRIIGTTEEAISSKEKETTIRIIPPRDQESKTEEEEEEEEQSKGGVRIL